MSNILKRADCWRGSELRNKVGRLLAEQQCVVHSSSPRRRGVAGRVPRDISCATPTAPRVLCLFPIKSSQALAHLMKHDRSSSQPPGRSGVRVCADRL